MKSIAAKYNIKVARIHTHIGSGSDPDVWLNVSLLSLNLVREFPDVVTLNLGGGYKVWSLYVCMYVPYTVVCAIIDITIVFCNVFSIWRCIHRTFIFENQVGRMSYEKSTDLIQVGLPVKQSFQQVLRIFSMICMN